MQEWVNKIKIFKCVQNGRLVLVKVNWFQVTDLEIEDASVVGNGISKYSPEK